MLEESERWESRRSSCCSYYSFSLGHSNPLTSKFVPLSREGDHNLPNIFHPFQPPILARLLCSHPTWTSPKGTGKRVRGLVHLLFFQGGWQRSLWNVAQKKPFSMSIGDGGTGSWMVFKRQAIKKKNPSSEEYTVLYMFFCSIVQSTNVYLNASKSSVLFEGVGNILKKKGKQVKEKTYAIYAWMKRSGFVPIGPRGLFKP